jgi:histidinol-phosphate aminotransferase
VSPPLPRPAPHVAALPLSRPFVAPEELARLGGHADLLRLGANESSFGPPPAALAAMREALPYTSWYGDPESTELREALAALHGCAVDEIVVAAGIDDLLGLCVRGYLAPGEVAVTTLGSYPTFVYHVSGYGGALETVPYALDGRVQLDALAAAARAAHAKLVYLANPDNPSGSFAGPADVAAFVAALPEDALLVLDEAYVDFVPSGEVLAGAVHPRIVRTRTFSKAYGMAGARIGYALAAREVIETFGKIRLQYGVNRTAQVGALAALPERRFVADVVDEVARGREEYAVTARHAGLSVLGSHANFVLIDAGARERAERLLTALLERGVFVRKPGAAPLDRCIRVTVGTAAQRARFAAIFGEAVRALEANPQPA